MNPQTPSPVSIQSPSKLPLILVGLVLVLSAGAGGIYIGKYLYSSKVQPTSLAEVSTDLSTIPSPGVIKNIPVVNMDVDNWKQFSLTDIGLTFKYPPEIKVWRSPEGGRVYLEMVPYDEYQFFINIEALNKENLAKWSDLLSLKVGEINLTDNSAPFDFDANTARLRDIKIKTL